jgi:hypothetical protein
VDELTAPGPDHIARARRTARVLLAISLVLSVAVLTALIIWLATRPPSV